MSQPSNERAFDPSPRVAFAICAALSLIAAVIRILPAWGDFWLDEIWTWFSVRSIDSAVDVFTRIHNSNNNHLNSLAIYWIGDRPDWVAYRIPSLLAGIGSVPLAAALAWRRDRLEAVLASGLTAASFVLVHFSSEARGYSLAVFFALAATWFLEQDLKRPASWSALAFGCCAALGILSHLVFLFYFAGASAQAAWRLLGPARERRRGALRLLRLLVLPIAVFVWLYLVDLRYLEVGGGDTTELPALFSRTVGFALGLPPWPALAIPYLALAAAVFLAGVRLLRREGDDSWIQVVITVLVAPTLVLASMRPEVIVVRYFVIGIAFWLLLASRLLATALRAGGWRRSLGLAGLVLFAVGNTSHIVPFLEHGRGGYLEALRFMADHTEGPRITVGSDHDFRNGMVLRFYRRYLPEGRVLIYYRGAERPSGGPAWMIRHRQHRPDRVPQRIRDGAGNHYGLAAEFTSQAISGFYWALYRNLDEAAFGPAGERDPEATAPADLSGSPGTGVAQ